MVWLVDINGNLTELLTLVDKVLVLVRPSPESLQAVPPCHLSQIPSPAAINYITPCAYELCTNPNVSCKLFVALVKCEEAKQVQCI